MENSKSTRSNTGYKGISKRSRTGNYEVNVRFPENELGSKHRFQVGTFNDLEIAKQKRIEFIKSLL